MHLNNLTVALAGGRTPGGNVTALAAPLLLQVRTVTVPVSVETGVGCNRHKLMESVQLLLWTTKLLKPFSVWYVLHRLSLQALGQSPQVGPAL